MADQDKPSRWRWKKDKRGRATGRTWQDELKQMSQLPTAFRLTRLPLIGKYLYRNTFVGDPEARQWIIPINQVIQRGKSMALPLEVLTPLFQKASYLKRSPVCICRQAYSCQTYPHGIACIWMGEAARAMPPHWGEGISYEEALSHAKKAVSLGLVPTVVYDSTMISRLAVCFCCDCCCDIRLGLKVGPKAFWDRVLPTPGITPNVDERCNLCGACAEPGVCHVDAIALGDAKAQIDKEHCVTCGRCAAVCPMQAISFQMDPQVDVVEMLLARIAERTDITAAAKTASG